MPQGPKLIVLAAVLAWYVVLGVFAMAVYTLDKRAAKRGHRRFPEAKLRLIELIGGAFGAAIAQRLLRHKTSKPGFRALTLLIAALHGAVACGVGWWAFSG